MPEIIQDPTLQALYFLQHQQRHNILLVACILAGVPVQTLLADPMKHGLQNLTRSSINTRYSRNKAALKRAGMLPNEA
jgi:predicted aconitase with swiveling domain